MTETSQVLDGAETVADATVQTVNRDELNEAIARRQSALERARSAEERLAQLEAAQADRDRAEKEAQGRYQELAQEAEAKAADLLAKLEANSLKLNSLSDKHRQSLDRRFENLPETVREHLQQQFGESPNLEAYESAVSLAESLQAQTAPAVMPRTIGAQPSAGRVTAVSNGGKATAQEIATMTRAEQRAYLKRHYG